MPITADEFRRMGNQYLEIGRMPPYNLRNKYLEDLNGFSVEKIANSLCAAAHEIKSLLPFSSPLKTLYDRGEPIALEIYPSAVLAALFPHAEHALKPLMIRTVAQLLEIRKESNGLELNSHIRYYLSNTKKAGWGMLLLLYEALVMCNTKYSTLPDVLDIKEDIFDWAGGYDKNMKLYDPDSQSMENTAYKIVIMLITQLSGRPQHYLENLSLKNRTETEKMGIAKAYTYFVQAQ